MSYEEIRIAAEFIGGRTGRARHDTALVLGSGLSSYGAALPGAFEIPYSEIPGSRCRRWRAIGDPCSRRW